MSKRLLLWDIDATLITTAGAGEQALRVIVTRRYGVEDDLRDIEIAGRTDPAIVCSILQKYGVPSTAENVSGFLDQYIDYLGALLPQLKGHVMPGISEILKRLQTNRVGCWRF